MDADTGTASSPRQVEHGTEDASQWLGMKTDSHHEALAQALSRIEEKNCQQINSLQALRVQVEKLGSQIEPSNDTAIKLKDDVIGDIKQITAEAEKAHVEEAGLLKQVASAAENFQKGRTEKRVADREMTELWRDTVFQWEVSGQQPGDDEDYSSGYEDEPEDEDPGPPPTGDIDASDMPVGIGVHEGPVETWSPDDPSILRFSDIQDSDDEDIDPDIDDLDFGVEDGGPGTGQQTRVPLYIGNISGASYNGSSSYAMGLTRGEHGRRSNGSIAPSPKQEPSTPPDPGAVDDFERGRHNSLARSHHFRSRSYGGTDMSPPRDDDEESGKLQLRDFQAEEEHRPESLAGKSQAPMAEAELETASRDLLQPAAVLHELHQSELQSKDFPAIEESGGMPRRTLAAPPRMARLAARDQGSARRRRRSKRTSTSDHASSVSEGSAGPPSVLLHELERAEQGWWWWHLYAFPRTLLSGMYSRVLSTLHTAVMHPAKWPQVMRALEVSPYVFTAQVLVSAWRERAIWLQANGTTREYMLDRVHGDPSWWWLPGVDPRLMMGWYGVAVCGLALASARMLWRATCAVSRPSSSSDSESPLSRGGRVGNVTAWTE